ncbi:MAG: (deoxy)nucleoside triphosphate pyrophosphohydrolase [Rhodospirillaceae bacterium]|nr:(deoxy)nucleoside triphosphate pyrophosphohydrolase [Rhodospirillaceae bacterium]
MTGTAATRPLQAQVEVVAGLITDASGRVLVGRRREGTHMEGYWEFPGGKRRPGEGPRGALERELREELGIVVLGAEFMAELTHCYPDRRVHLELWRVDRFDGEPSAREGQALKWVAPENLLMLPLLPADQPLVEALLTLAS